jgi:ribonuclease D
MQRSKKIKEPIPEEFATLKEGAEFWDKHDLTDYWEFTKEVEGDIKVPPTPRYVPLEKEISEFISKIAQKQHISPETLVNSWLKERLLKQIKNARATSISPS